MALIFFILSLSLIVLVHEFGHLLAAKLFGVYCEEFSVGMGPKLISHRFKETTYSIRAIPLGGFVAMAGDSDNALETSVDQTNIPFERTLKGVARWKGIIIMLAGIFMNFVLAFVIMAMVFLNVGHYVGSPTPILKEVVVNSPADVAGLQANDKIVYMAYEDLNIDYRPKNFDDIVNFMYGHETEVLTLQVLRDDEIFETKLKAEFNDELNRYLIGISATPAEPVEVNFFNCWGFGAEFLVNSTRTIFMSLGQLFKGIGLENLSGPIGVYEVTSDALELGAQTYFMIIAVLSLNIGICNALPLPILDGGRVLISLIEGLIGHSLSQKTINILMSVSMALLIVLFSLGTFKDVVHLFW